ncbi:unnamed protein product [Prunus brigantina]
MAKTGGVVMEKIGEASQWIASKIKDFLQYLSNKATELLNVARRFFDNFSEEFKEALVKSKCVIDDTIAKATELMSKWTDAACNSIVQLKNLVASMLKLMLDLHRSGLKRFLSLMQELVRKTKTKCVLFPASGELRDLICLTKGLLELINMLVKPSDLFYVVNEAVGRYIENPQMTPAEMKKCLAVDSDEGARAVESSSSQALVLYEADSILEPYEGMEFESEDAAKIFYDEYARRVGFVMRVMSCRRSERDGRILARRLGCNKEGHCVSIRGKFGPVRKPRASTREGCKAMIHVKYDKSSKWVITKFIKDHNHPLVVSPREARQTMDEKDKKIQELTAELRNKKRLCTTYQEQLTAFTKIVEEYSDHLSKKVQNVVSNLKEFESIDRELSQHR